MSKQIEISMDGFKDALEQIKVKLNQAQEWLKNFFKTIDDYETIAVAGIGVGVVLVIVGIIII